LTSLVYKTSTSQQLSLQIPNRSILQGLSSRFGRSIAIDGCRNGGSTYERHLDGGLLSSVEVVVEGSSSSKNSDQVRMPRFAQAAAHQFSGGWWPASTSKQHETRNIIRLACDANTGICQTRRFIVRRVAHGGRHDLPINIVKRTLPSEGCPATAGGHFDFNTNRSLAVWQRGGLHSIPLSFAVKLLQHPSSLHEAADLSWLRRLAR